MPPHSSRKRRWRIVLLCIISFVLLACLTVLALRSTGLDVEIAKIRAAGLPVSVDDLNRWYPAVTPERNAALGVIAAAELRKTESSQIQMPKRGEEIGPELLSDLRDYVTNNRATLDGLRTALQLPESRYPVAFSSNTIATGPPNPNLSQIKALAQLLHYEAVHLTSEGKSKAAFSAVRDGFELAATLRNEPVLISELVRIACSAIALRSLECSLPAGKFDEHELQEISEWLARTEADCSRSWHRAIIGERTFGIQHFTAIMQNLANPASAWDSFRASLYRGLGFHERDLRVYLEMMARFSSAMTNTLPTAYTESIAVDQELKRRFSTGLGRFAFVSQAILPGLVKATGKEAALVTSLRCAQAAVAVERYRVENNGTLPENLQQLVPKFLAGLPRDAAKGEPLVFEGIRGGYQISSPAAAVILDNKSNTSFPVVPWKFKSDQDPATLGP